MTNIVPMMRAEGVKHSELRAALREAFNLDEDDQALIDTLEGESNYTDLLAIGLREAKAREAMAEGLQGLVDKMRERKARLEHSAKQIRAAAAESMINAGERKVVLPDFTVTVRMGKPRLIIDEVRLSDEYKLPVVSMKVNKEAVQSAVDTGDVPEGVQIANPQPVLTVRSA